MRSGSRPATRPPQSVMTGSRSAHRARSTPKPGHMVPPSNANAGYAPVGSPATRTNAIPSAPTTSNAMISPMPLTIPVPRHLEPHPEDVRPRLARLGHPDEMTGLEPPVQRWANFLIAAERNLSDVQSRFFEARRDGDPDAMATLTAQWESAERAV